MQEVPTPLSRRCLVARPSVLRPLQQSGTKGGCCVFEKTTGPCKSAVVCQSHEIPCGVLPAPCDSASLLLYKLRSRRESSVAHDAARGVQGRPEGGTRGGYFCTVERPRSSFLGRSVTLTRRGRPAAALTHAIVVSSLFQARKICLPSTCSRTRVLRPSCSKSTAEVSLARLRHHAT